MASTSSHLTPPNGPLTLFSIAGDGLHLEHRLQTLAAPSRIALSSCADWLYAEAPRDE